MYFRPSLELIAVNCISPSLVVVNVIINSSYDNGHINNNSKDIIKPIIAKREAAK
jgi:hypothetical protein